MKRGGLGSGTVNEVLLYLLLKEQFSGKVDARTAEIELGKYRWEHFKKGGLSVMAFQTTIDEWLGRSQKITQFDGIRCIRNALPQVFRDRTKTFNTGKCWSIHPVPIVVSYVMFSFSFIMIMVLLLLHHLVLSFI